MPCTKKHDKNERGCQTLRDVINGQPSSVFVLIAVERVLQHDDDRDDLGESGVHVPLFPLERRRRSFALHRNHDSLIP